MHSLLVIEITIGSTANTCCTHTNILVFWVYGHMYGLPFLGNLHWSIYTSL